MAAAALVTAALLLVAQSAAATQASYQITTLKQEQAKLLADRDQLQAQLAGDRAANRVASAAQQLGLAHPSRWQYLNPAGGSPIALAPRPAESHTGLLNGVLAVLGAVVGRPNATDQSH